MKLQTLKKRRQFLAVSGGRKWVCPAFVLQRGEAGAGEVRPSFGFVVTRWQGGAVVRNRIKRRLKEAVRHVLKEKKVRLPSSHYVCIARKGALELPFSMLRSQLGRGIRFLHPSSGRS